MEQGEITRGRGLASVEHCFRDKFNSLQKVIAYKFRCRAAAEKKREKKKRKKERKENRNATPSEGIDTLVPSTFSRTCTK